MKEINKPHYDLEHIKSVFRTVNRLNMTYTAMQGQYELGFSDQEVVDAVQSITPTDFYKSLLPTHTGFAEWQDVYKPTFKGIELYVKFQANRRGEMIISFKKK